MDTLVECIKTSVTTDDKNNGEGIQDFKLLEECLSTDLLCRRTNFDAIQMTEVILLLVLIVESKRS